MPKGPKGQKLLAGLESNAVHVMRVLTDEAVGISLSRNKFRNIFLDFWSKS